MLNLKSIFILVRKYHWVISVIAIIILYSLFWSEKGKVGDFKKLNDLQSSRVTKWKDEAGKNRARAEIAEIEAKNAKLVLNDELKAYISKEVGNIKKNLISYSSVKANTKGTSGGSAVDTVIEVSQIEKVAAKHFKIDDKYLKMEAIYLPDLDSLVIDYQVSHNFDITYYYRRLGKAPFNIFRRKVATAQIRFDNPASQADSLHTIVLERKKNLFKQIFGR